jgi:hypothetical protein
VKTREARKREAMYVMAGGAGRSLLRWKASSPATGCCEKRSRVMTKRENRGTPHACPWEHRRDASHGWSLADGTGEHSAALHREAHLDKDRGI